MILRYDRFGSTRIVWMVDNDAEENLRHRRNDSSVAPRTEQEQAIINREAAIKQNELAEYRPDLLPWWGDMRHRLHDDSAIQSVGMSYLEDARGWPFRCLWWTAEMHMTTLILAPQNLHLFEARNREQVYGGIALENSSRFQALQSRVLPMRIIWPGFVANSLLFAVGWAALPFVLSRHRRKKAARMSGPSNRDFPSTRHTSRRT
jgi:hypothetical protein